LIVRLVSDVASGVFECVLLDFVPFSENDFVAAEVERRLV